MDTSKIPCQIWERVNPGFWRRGFDFDNDRRRRDTIGDKAARSWLACLLPGGQTMAVKNSQDAKLSSNDSGLGWYWKPRRGQDETGQGTARTKYLLTYLSMYYQCCCSTGPDTWVWGWLQARDEAADQVRSRRWRCNINCYHHITATSRSM